MSDNVSRRNRELAHPAKVKRLEWKAESNGYQWTAARVTGHAVPQFLIEWSLTRYRVREIDGRGMVRYYNNAEFDTLAKAKAAASARHRRTAVTW